MRKRHKILSIVILRFSVWYAPPQDIDLPTTEAQCEKLSFNPWNGLNAHKPLGNMQRARRAVYLAGAHYRAADMGLQQPQPLHKDYPRCRKTLPFMAGI